VDAGVDVVVEVGTRRRPQPQPCEIATTLVLAGPVVSARAHLDGADPFPTRFLGPITG